MRARTNISVKERRQFVLSDFRGVDFSSSPLRVQANRAADMSNFIFENGANRKRHGWKQLIQIKDPQNGMPLEIDGVYPYKRNDQTELLVYAGKSFWKVYEDQGEYRFDKIVESTVYAPSQALRRDGKCQFFYNLNYIYIIGTGEYLRYSVIDEKIEALGDSNTRGPQTNVYIPTTTISIDPIDVSDTVRKSLDPVNRLTAFRKNTLVGSEEGEKTWQLDVDNIPFGSYLSVEVSIRLEDGEIATKFYDNSGEDRSKLYLWESGAPQKVAGEILNVFGRIKLNDPTPAPISGRDNITVTFTTGGDRRSSIGGCCFGTLFGVGGNSDRLFLAGNDEYPNVEFFSEADDFTYFPDTFTAALGTDQSPITGFLRMSDHTLAIFKRQIASEASTFFQSGEYREFYESDGDLDKILPVFRITAAANDESAVNPWCAVNFFGDNMILSKNGVFAIELTENVATDARIARLRSYAINAKLLQHKNLADAVGIVWKGKYYLSIDGVCYVADSQHRYQLEGNASFQYEWCYWENIPARIWFVVNGDLWFATDDGKFCMFDDAYCDRTFVRTEIGDITFHYSTNRIVHGPIGKICENDRMILKTEGVFGIYQDQFIKISDNRLCVSETDILKIYEGTEVYVSGVGSGGLVEGKPYYIGDVDLAACTFVLMDESNIPQNLDGIDCSELCLLLRFSGRTLYLCDIEQGAFRVKLSEDGEVLQLKNYFQPDENAEGLIPINPIAEFWHYEPVVAKWKTPFFDFGTNECGKTLLKLTISTDSMNGGRLSFGYETRTHVRELSTSGVGRFSFDDLDFSDFSFESGFLSSYSVKVKERNFNYIVFYFRSDTDRDCSVNNLTVTYKINKRNLGVR